PQERAAHLQAFRQKLRERIPEDKAFAVQFGEVRFLSSDTKQRPLVRYILEKVDEQLRTDKMVDYDKMTIEHLSPENPGAGQQAKGLDAGNIGNLIFVSEGLNGKMKNKDFPAKKKILGEAGIPFDKVLKGATNWGSKEIAARAAQLAQLGREKIWKL
ncbi:MAG: HNH endonuclease family protein, partial [Xanthobacteraceae bacterium]